MLFIAHTLKFFSTSCICISLNITRSCLWRASRYVSISRFFIAVPSIMGHRWRKVSHFRGQIINVLHFQQGAFLLKAGAGETSSTCVSEPQDSSADWIGVHYAYAAICILENPTLTQSELQIRVAHDPSPSTQTSTCLSALLWGCHTGLRRARPEKVFLL